MADRARFYFLITYFKPSGKYYTAAAVEWEIRDAGQGLAYLQDAISKIRGIRDNGGQGSLPGLMSDGWDGLILIQQAQRHTMAMHLSPDHCVPVGVPHILMPRTADEKPGRAYERI